MNKLLTFSALVDRCTAGLGRLLGWLIFASSVISAGNAVSRKFFNFSSNAFLEIQWYLFGAAFLLAGAYVLQLNEHVRIDVVSSRLSPRARIWIDMVGIVCFLLPTSMLFIFYGFPMFLQSFQLQEVSGDAGGLLRWPAKALVPIGFSLLAVQGLSELIKRANELQKLGRPQAGKTQGAQDAA